MVASLRWIYSPASSFALSGLMKLRRSASILLANISVINWWKRSTSGVEVVCAQHDAVRIYVTGTLGLRWLKLSRFGGSVFMGTGCFVRGSVCGSAMSYPSSHRQISHGYWRASIIYALHCIAPGVKNNVLKCSPSGGSWGLGALGPAICVALCNGETQRLPAWALEAPRRGPGRAPKANAFWQQHIENWLKIRYLHP